MEIEVDRYCYVCGPENPEGLHAVFQYEPGKATGTFHPRPEHQGYTGVSHGGVLAALLDEAMVYASVTLGRWVATAEMTVRYLKPAPTGAVLTIHAEVTGQQRRIVHCRAELRDGDGVVIATATAKMMQGRELREEELSR